MSDDLLIFFLGFGMGLFVWGTTYAAVGIARGFRVVAGAGVGG